MTISGGWLMRYKKGGKTYKCVFKNEVMSLFPGLPGCPGEILLLDYFLIYSSESETSGDQQEATRRFENRSRSDEIKLILVSV